MTRWLARTLFYLNATIWLALGVASLIRAVDDSSDHAFAMLVIAVMMFGNAGAMLVSGWGIGRAHRGFYYLALAVLVVNIILTFTDQFGLLDLVTLIIDLVLLGILLSVPITHVPPRQEAEREQKL